MSLTNLRPPSSFGYEKQPFLNFNQTTVAQNTWYTALATIYGGIKVYIISILQTNTETDAKDVTCELAFDGITTTANTGLANNTPNYLQILYSADDVGYNAATFSPMPSNSILECRKLGIRIRTTSVAGTAQTLRVRMHYGLLKPLS